MQPEELAILAAFSDMTPAQQKTVYENPMCTKFRHDLALARVSLDFSMRDNYNLRFDQHGGVATPIK